MTRVAAILLAMTMLLHGAVAHSRPVPGVTPVADVRFDYPGVLPENVPSLVGIKPGDMFSSRQVRDGIRLVYLTGRFSDVSVDGRDTPGGVELTFRLTPRTVITEMDVAGNDELSDRSILAVTGMDEGDYYDARKLDTARNSVLKLYADNGYKDAVAYVTGTALDIFSTSVDVLVKEGPPSVVGAVRFTGKPSLPEDSMMGEMEFRPGDVLKKAGLELSVENLTALYVGHDYVNVDIQAPKISYEGSRADVEFEIDPGPKLEVSFEGNDEFSDGKLRDELTFWADKDASPESVTENLGRIVKLYRDKGYYHASVTSRTEEGGNPPVTSVRFIISEGPRAALENITFTGNHEVEDDEILKVMELDVSSVFRDRFITDDAVERDAGRIAALYESRGFLGATAMPGQVEFEEGGSLASINFAIEEGPRTIISDVRILGNDGISSEELYGVIGHLRGGPLNPQQLTQDRNTILNMYSQKGFIHATVDVQRELSEDSGSAVVTYDITEGFPVYIGNIILRGNRDVKDLVVYRELLFEKGDLYDYEKILRSQQRVYRLGVMSKVRIQPVRPDKAEAVKDLLVSVKERAAGAVEFGVGYGEFDKLRGFAEVSYRNMFGYGHVLSVRGEASSKELKAAISYKWPWFLGYAMDFRSSLVYLDAEKPNYDIVDFIYSAGFDKVFSENVTASLYYQYEQLKLNAPAGAVLAPEDKDKSNLASISPSIIFDYRDNPFNATSGSLHGLVVKYASSSFGSTVDFVKVTGQTSWYFPVYKGIVFGVSARGGIQGLITGKLEVPISERFFLGGASTLRGYAYETVAPLGFDGTPAGGDSMALFNTEVRVPMPYGFGLVGFLDAGNVWLLNKKASFAALDQRGTNGLRYGAGIGIRYDTPVGPLRLDYGFKLNRLEGESAAVLHFTLGQAF